MQLHTQLDELEKAAANFRTSTLQSDELVAFQVLTGDLGFDNLHNGGRPHPLLTQYEQLPVCLCTRALVPACLGFEHAWRVTCTASACMDACMSSLTL